jgi:hypothetical protein
MASKDGVEDGNQLQAKIEGLTNRLEQSMENLRIAHAEELAKLTFNCREGIQQLHNSFTLELDQLQQAHELKMTKLEQEVHYLKEMTQSQRMMMEANLDYIKELEDRFPAK